MALIPIAIAHAPRQSLQLEVFLSLEGLTFSLLHDGVLLLDHSVLGLCRHDDESQPLKHLWTKTLSMPDEGVELILRLDWVGEQLLVRFLLKDDSLALRYELEDNGESGIVGERTTFRFGSDVSLLIDPTLRPTVDARLLTPPVLLEMDSGIYVSIRNSSSHTYPEPVLRLERGGQLCVVRPSERIAYPEGVLITPWWILSIIRP